MSRRGSAVEPWFHGLISREQAEAELHRTPRGTFMVRIAVERLGYSVLVSQDIGFHHYSVMEDGSGR